MYIEPVFADLDWQCTIKNLKFQLAQVSSENLATPVVEKCSCTEN